jgi:hypothetical protein
MLAMHGVCGTWRRSEAQIAAEFPGIGSNRAELQQLLASCPSSLMYSWASPQLTRGYHSAQMRAVELVAFILAWCCVCETQKRWLQKRCCVSFVFKLR